MRWILLALFASCGGAQVDAWNEDLCQTCGSGGISCVGTRCEQPDPDGPWFCTCCVAGERGSFGLEIPDPQLCVDLDLAATE